MQKRFLSAFLVLCMVLALLPAEVFAADNEPSFAEPTVTGFTVTYDGGKTVDLLGSQPTISMPTGSKPIFTVTFDNTTLLDMVFVTSTKSGETKYLEAKPSGNKFVTDGYFDPSDTDYMPGTIAVSYSKKQVEVSESDTINNIALTNLKTQIEAQGISISQINPGDDEVTAKVVLGAYFAGVGGEFVDASISKLESSAGIDSNEVKNWLGVYNDLTSYALKGENGQDYTLYFANKDWSDANSYIMLLRDVGKNQYIKMALNGTGLKEVAKKLSSTSTVVTPYLNYVAISTEMDELREQVEANHTMTSAQKEEAYRQIDALERDKQLLVMGLTFIPLFFGTAGVAAPLMITALLAGYSSAADYFWANRIGMIQGCAPISGAFANDGANALTNAKTSNYQDGWITNGVIISDGNYYLAENIIDGFFIGGHDWGTPITVNATIDLNGHTCAQFYVTAGSTLRLYDSKYNADRLESSGIVRSVVIEEKSRVHIENCIIGDITIREGSEVALSSGTINNNIDIVDTETTVNMTGGTCNGAIRNRGTLNVTGGIVNNITCYSNGEVIVANAIIGTASNGGNFNITSGTIGPLSNSGVMEIYGGTFSAVDKSTPCIGNRGEMTIVNGTISSEGIAISNNGGKLIINGGTIESALNESATGCVYINAGEVIINGGTIRALRDTSGIYFTGLNDGKLYINGGTVSGNNGVNWLRGVVTICGGKIIGKETGLRFGGQWQPKLLLAIQSDTQMEIVGNSAAIASFNSSPPYIEVSATKGYTGNVTYYNTPGAVGVKMTIQEAAKIDFATPYICLVAEGASGGPGSGGDTPSCEHIYTSKVTSPTCTERGYTTYSCSKCGDSYQDNYTNALGHNFGEWVIVKEATSTTSGTRERVCSVCQYKETSTIPATGGSISGSGGNSSGGGSSHTSPTYTPTVEQPREGGTVSISPSRPERGDKVTITPSPEVGYEIAEITVTSSNGKAVEVKANSDGTYSFVQPSGKVKIEVSYKPVEPVKTEWSNPFTDISKNEWYYDAVRYVQENGLMGGYGNGAFGPNDILSRAQLAQILYNRAGKPNISGGSVFSDVANGAWCADAITWAARNGIVGGYGNGTFGPNDPITREQLAVMLWRYAGSPAATNKELHFTDADEISDYALNALRWAVENGILNGYGDGRLGPKGQATRAQVAQMLKNYLER